VTHVSDIQTNVTMPKIVEKHIVLKQVLAVEASDVDEELLAEESDASLARELKHEHEHEQWKQVPIITIQQKIAEIQQREIVHRFVEEPQVEVVDKIVEMQVQELQVPMVVTIKPKIIEQQIASERLAEMVVATVVIMVVAMNEMQRIVEILVGTAQDMIVVPVQKHEQLKQELAEEASDVEVEGKCESKQKLSKSTSSLSRSPEGGRIALRRRSSGKHPTLRDISACPSTGG
jgi:hypothetical protein